MTTPSPPQQPSLASWSAAAADRLLTVMQPRQRRPRLWGTPYMHKRRAQTCRRAEVGQKSVPKGPGSLLQTTTTSTSPIHTWLMVWKRWRHTGCQSSPPPPPCGPHTVSLRRYTPAFPHAVRGRPFGKPARFVADSGSWWQQGHRVEALRSTHPTTNSHLGQIQPQELIAFPNTAFLAMIMKDTTPNGQVSCFKGGYMGLQMAISKGQWLF